MAYGRRRRYRRKYGRRMRGRRTSMAKKAFRLAKRIANHTEETKYFRRSLDTDLVSGGGAGIVGGGIGSVKYAALVELTDLSAYSNAFPGVYGGLNQATQGNKIYFKRATAKWEIHMDNTNNEEETCNFTVAVVSVKRDLDGAIVAYSDDANWNSKNAILGALNDVTTSPADGQVIFDPRFVKVHYYRHFTRTMGGTSPGTAGESTRYGRFKIPINKMMRYNRTQGIPCEEQERLFFAVFTDNSSLDTENPRMNATFFATIKDTDVST